MGKVVYHEFLGSRLYVAVLCLSVVGIPVALIYLLSCTVTIVEEIEEPSEYLEAWKRKHNQSFWTRLFGTAKR